MDTGIILDLETTGLDSQSDQIIEIGLLEFSASSEHPPAIVSSYGALQDPGQPLSEDIKRITGLHDDLLRGRRIDWHLVKGMLEKSSIVIAHNAKFDIAFLKRRPELAEISYHWACSMRHVPWQQLGYRTTALNYLAADHGFVNPFAHRALFDCATTFRIVAPYLQELIKRSYEREILINAVNSRFETKDILRARGYRWDPDHRCWSRFVLECDLADEREFLTRDVYQGMALHQEVVVETSF